MQSNVELKAPATGGPRVVIVEDEMLIAWNISDVIERLNYRLVAMVNNAEDTVAAVVEHRPDLILMDISLAGLRDGIDAAHEIRERTGRGVVFLTAHADPTTERRARATGPEGNLYKPFHAAGLRAALQRILERPDSPPGDRAG